MRFHNPQSCSHLFPSFFASLIWVQTSSFPTKKRIFTVCFSSEGYIVPSFSLRSKKTKLMGLETLFIPLSQLNQFCCLSGSNYIAVTFLWSSCKSTSEASNTFGRIGELCPSLAVSQCHYTGLDAQASYDPVTSTFERDTEAVTCTCFLS